MGIASDNILPNVHVTMYPLPDMNPFSGLYAPTILANSLPTLGLSVNIAIIFISFFVFLRRYKNLRGNVV